MPSVPIIGTRSQHPGSYGRPLDHSNVGQGAQQLPLLMSRVDTQSRKIHRDETIIEQLTHEIAILKWHKFAKRSDQISPAQGSLLDDLLNTDLEAIEAELDGVGVWLAARRLSQGKLHWPSARLA